MRRRAWTRAVPVARHLVCRDRCCWWPPGPTGCSKPYSELVEARPRRVPLQHLTGSAAFRYVDLEVGPGVFVPRPETEVVAGGRRSGRGASRRAQPRRRRPLHRLGRDRVAVVHEVPARAVHAVELDEPAYGWAQRNLSGTGVDLRLGDAADAFADLEAASTSWCRTRRTSRSTLGERRARGARPRSRSWRSGPVRTASTMRMIEATAWRLLMPGVVVVEHADVQGESAPEVFGPPLGRCPRPCGPR